MTKKKSFEEVQELVKDRGLTLLSKEEDYRGVGFPLLVKCSKGHNYNSSIDKMKQGCGCPHCKGNAKRTTEEVQGAFQKRGYTLLSIYTNSHTKMDALCPQGHEITIAWTGFQSGHGCLLCGQARSIKASEKKKLNADFVRNFIEKEGYRLLTPYKNCHTKLEALCPNNHKWKFSWSKFRDGCRCLCKSDRQRWTLESVREHLKKESCVLLSKSLPGYHEHLQVLCPKEHIYPITLANFTQGHRCPKCFGCQSQAEIEVGRPYAHLNPIERDRTIITPKELDLYFPTQKVAIEYCGLYWHSDAQERITPGYHRDKLDKCIEQNIRLLTIFEDEWLNNKEICTSRINSALGIVQNKVFARKCLARQIPNKEAYEFLKRTHLQGPGTCKVAYGLFYDNQLVQVMTFGSPARAHTAKGKKVLEMKRLAGELNTIIIGGASKLFKLGLQYAKQNSFDIIKSYCDLRWGTGNLYAKLGFTKTYETKYTPHYTDFKNRFRNQNLAQNKKKTGKTEFEVAQEKGLWKIYDCGHQTWEYEVGLQTINLTLQELDKARAAKDSIQEQKLLEKLHQASQKHHYFD